MYVFDPQAIHEIALDAIRRTQALAQGSAKGIVEQRIEQVMDGLEARYPGQIDRTQPWLFSNAGGAMVQIKPVYASPREYILFFGTPTGTEGHSGRHPAAFYDTVLDGEAWYYREGQFTRDEHRTGDHIYVGRGESAGIHIPDHVWMVEYARGALPLIMPFGVADSLLSTLDLSTVARTLRAYVVLNLRSMRGSLGGRRRVLEQKASG